MKKIFYSVIAAVFAAMTFTSCGEGDFGGDYKVEGVELQDMCGTWVCTAVADDAWWTVNYYNGKYTPAFLNDYYGDPYGTDNPDANGDGIVDDKDFATYAQNDLLWDEVGGTFDVITTNTAANNTTEMLISDNAPYYMGLQSSYAVYSVNVDFANYAFSVGSIADESYKTVAVTPVTISKTYKNVQGDEEMPVVLSGKIMKNAAHAPGSKMVCDSIDYYVKYPNDCGKDIYYHVSGYRKTGYTEDNE